MIDGYLALSPRFLLAATIKQTKATKSRIKAKNEILQIDQASCAFQDRQHIGKHLFPKLEIPDFSAAEKGGSSHVLQILHRLCQPGMLGSDVLPAAVFCQCGQLGGGELFLQHLSRPLVAQTEIEGCTGEREVQNHQQTKHFIDGLAQADYNIEHYQQGEIGQRKGEHPRPGQQPGEQQSKPYQR